MLEKENEYKGYPLFNDIDDATLRNRNRGVCLRNMAVSGRTKNNKVSPSATLDMFSYFNLLPVEDRKEVLSNFIEHCKQDGFDISLGVH